MFTSNQGNMKPVVKKMCIIGLGLIGGSLGMALTQRGFAQEVVGVDVSEDILAKGLTLQAITRGATAYEAAVSNADLVVLAVPVRKIVPVAAAIKPLLKSGCVVTDVGSTKEGIVTALEEIFHPQCHFVGGHPMAGSEQAGIGAADKYLLENAFYLVTPTARTDEAALELVIKMVEAAGAKPISIKPDEHDLIVAAISHLPHLVAVSLVNGVRDLPANGHDPLAFAAGGFRDSTRIASADPKLWLDICFSNKTKILAVLQQFKNALSKLEASLATGDEAAFLRHFRQANEARAKIPAKIKGFLPGIHQVIVTIPDKPGTIGEIAQILGRQKINIMDIEILRVREGEGGTVKLGFVSQEVADEAVRVLIEHQVIAKRM